MDTPSQKENGSKKATYNHTSQITLVQPKSSDGRHWSVFEKVLLALVLLFFVGFLIFVVLYATTEAATTTKEAKDKQADDDDRCYSADCVAVSAKIISSMNFSADPCDNFYNYACGGWERDNDIPDTESSWGQFDILNLANDNVLKKLVKDPKTKLIYKDNAAVQKAFKYYETCMNRSRINDQGAQPLIDLIADYHSWNVTGNGTWREESWNFTTAMIAIQRKWYANPFFAISTGADYYNSTVNVIELDQSGLGMTKDNYLNNGTDDEK
ncbi:endothelin-converting enzyme homolog isoform X1, partial [Paramuricea clavata]